MFNNIKNFFKSEQKKAIKVFGRQKFEEKNNINKVTENNETIIQNNGLGYGKEDNKMIVIEIPPVYRALRITARREPIPYEKGDYENEVVNAVEYTCSERELRKTDSYNYGTSVEGIGLVKLPDMGWCGAENIYQYKLEKMGRDRYYRYYFDDGTYDVIGINADYRMKKLMDEFIAYITMGASIEDGRMLWNAFYKDALENKWKWSSKDYLIEHREDFFVPFEHFSEKRKLAYKLVKCINEEEDVILNSIHFTDLQKAFNDFTKLNNIKEGENLKLLYRINTHRESICEVEKIYLTEGISFDVSNNFYYYDEFKENTSIQDIKYISENSRVIYI
ncbi:hypothetical protein [Clostridium butyricum]